MKTTTEPTPESGNPAETVTAIPVDPNLTVAGVTVEKARELLAQPNPPPTLEPETIETPPAETQVAETVQPPPVVQPPVTQEAVPPPSQTPPHPSVNGASDPFRFYRKVSVQMPLYVDKARIQFEVLGDNIGVIKLDPNKDARTIEVLDECARVKRGGVLVIDEQAYLDSKKNHPFLKSAPRFQPQKLRVWDSKPKRVSPAVSGNVAAAVRSNTMRPSPAVGGSGGSAGAVVGGDVAGAGTPATFTPNLRPKSGVLKTPASGQFKPGVVPPFPPPLK